MAERRQATIYLNGKPVENQIKSLVAEKKKLNAEIDRMIRGSDEYIAHAKEIGKVNSIIDNHNRALKPVISSYSTLATGGLAKLGGLAAGAFSADIIISYGKHLFDLSGKMQLLEQKARTVFAEVFPQVTAEAERNAAAMGLTNSQYIANAASIADLLIPMKFSREEAASMSTQLNNLSGALSEWTGGQRTATEVSQTISKAILGEREELKGLGISILEEDVKNRVRAKGLQNLTGEYLQQARAIATMELIMEKSTDAQAAFAAGSDTLVRRQAALRAELTNISERLATTLFPVFERLVGIASSFTAGLAEVADGFTSLVNPAKASTDAFNDQAAKVSKLQAELPPLLDRYDELKGKSKLTKTEQSELAKVIEQIGILTPTAITEIDNYGNALGINASKSREFLAAEQKRLKFLNEEAINDTFQQAKKLKAARDKVKAEIESGTTTQTVRTGYGSVQQEIGLKDEDIAKRTKKLNELTEALEGARNQLKFLKGEPLINPTTADKPIPVAPVLQQSSGGKSGTKTKVDEVKKGEEEIQKILEKFRLENYLATLEDDEKKIEQLRAKYDAEIDEVKKLEEKKVEGATEARIELERLKEEAITALTNQLLQERYIKEEEAQTALDEKRIQAIGKNVEDELKAREEFNKLRDDFLLTEEEKALKELDDNYAELRSKAELHGLDLLALEKAYREQRAAIIKLYNKQELDENKKKRILELNAVAEENSKKAAAIGDLLTQVQGVLGEHTAVVKGLVLAQIAFSTAEAIAVGTAKAIAAGPFPQNLAAIVSTVATVLANIARAKTILSGAPKVDQRYTGGFYDVTGKDDGRSYNAQYIGAPGTGLLPDRPVLLASERGQEYLVSNPDLQNPRVLNYVRAIENIRTARTGGGTPQFADGGFTTGAAGEGSSALAQLAPLLMQMEAVLGSLDSTLGNGIEAKLNDETAVALVQRFRVLNKASGGVL